MVGGERWCVVSLWLCEDFESNLDDVFNAMRMQIRWVRAVAVLPRNRAQSSAAYLESRSI